MLDLSTIRAHAADQDRGAWFDIIDPTDGTLTGLRFLVVGPDSATQHRAQLAVTDELAEMADARGRVSAEAREKARLRALAASVLRWEATEDGQPVPFSTEAVMRVFAASRWVRDQVDAFAAQRRPLRKNA